MNARNLTAAEIGEHLLPALQNYRRWRWARLSYESACDHPDRRAVLLILEQEKRALQKLLQAIDELPEGGGSATVE